jgi:hypothetical protein
MGLTPRDPAYYVQHGESPAQARAAARAYRLKQQGGADTTANRTGGRPKDYIGKPGGATDSADLGKVTKYSLPPGLKGTRAGGMITGRQSANEQGQHVLAMQKFLRSKGYNIQVDGKMGPQTKAAMNAWTVGGPKDPRITAAQWNMHQRGEGSLAGRKQGSLGGSTPSVQPLGGGHHGHGHSGSGSGLGGIGGGADLQNIPTSYADSAANMQYGPQIADMLQQIKDAKGQGAQNIHDIGNWYGMVQTALKQARGEAAQSGQQAVNSDTALMKGLMASMGNDNAAAEIGAQGARATAMQQGANNNEQQYTADMAPIYQAMQAGAASRQLALNHQNESGLASKLNALYGAQGAAKQAELEKIMEYNNQLAQQRFGNTLSAEQTAAAAAMTGAQIKGLNAATSKTAKGGFIPWAKLNANDQTKLIDMAMANVADPGHGGALYPNMDMEHAWKAVRTYLVGKGYSNAKYTGSGQYAPRPINGVSRQMRQSILTALTAARNQGYIQKANNAPGYGNLSY